MKNKTFNILLASTAILLLLLNLSFNFWSETIFNKDNETTTKDSEQEISDSVDLVMPIKISKMSNTEYQLIAENLGSSPLAFQLSFNTNAKVSEIVVNEIFDAPLTKQLDENNWLISGGILENSAGDNKNITFLAKVIFIEEPQEFIIFGEGESYAIIDDETRAVFEGTTLQVSEATN